MKLIEVPDVNAHVVPKVPDEEAFDLHVVPGGGVLTRDLHGVTSFEVDSDGSLWVFGPEGRQEAVFAPGKWSYARREGED